MEITEYDEYVPEKELDKNFKIPRKRTAEDSFGAQATDAYAEYYAQAAQIRAAQAAQYAQYANSQVQNQQRQFVQAQALTGQGHYASLSGAASQATTHSNAKPPVRYPVKQVNTNIPPPPITPANNSLNVARQRNPNSTVSPSYNTSGQAENTYPGFRGNEYRTFSGSGNSGGSGARRSMGGTWNEAQNRNWNSAGGNNMVNYNRNPNDNAGVGNRNSGAGMNRSWNATANNSDSRNKNWGDERQNRNWGSGNFGGGDSEWNRRNFGSGNNWNSNSGNEYGNDDGFDESNDFPGDVRKGSFAGMENNGNNRFGVSKPGFGDGYDNGRFGYGNRQQWDLEGNMTDQGFGNARGVSGGVGRGGFNESEMNNRPGGFRGGRGRGYGGNFGFNNDRSNQMNKPRPYQRKEKPKIKQDLAPMLPPDVNDETLPKELRSMFQPLYCKLCSLQMSSNIMAKMHYKSKNHEKKIRKYLVEHAEKTGEPVHARAALSILQEKKEKEEETDPKYFHCDVCDLQLTGKLHAESHYMGKNHNAVVMGKKRPSGKGYYNAEGKWVRKTETKQTLPEGEDNFGLAFRKTSENTTDSNDATASTEKPALRGKFTCCICNISCPCQEQIDMHFSGSKHKKKLKHLGICPENFEVPKETETESSVTGEDADLQLDPTEAADVKRNDFSRYRTPSGFYYCRKCNLTSNSEIQMKQHLTSKNHLRPKKEKKETEQPKEKPTE